jgi:hypothetical protein
MSMAAMMLSGMGMMEHGMMKGPGMNDDGTLDIGYDGPMDR